MGKPWFEKAGIFVRWGDYSERKSKKEIIWQMLMGMPLVLLSLPLIIVIDIDLLEEVKRNDILNLLGNLAAMLFITFFLGVVSFVFIKIFVRGMIALIKHKYKKSL